MATKQLIETSIWKDKWFRTKLDRQSRLLFVYLISNESINPAGLYEVDIDYTKKYLGVSDFPKMMKLLEPKVFFDRSQDIVWIVKYARKNSRGPKIKKSIENTLNKYISSSLVKEFLCFYKDFKFQIDRKGYLKKEKDYQGDTIVSNDNDNDNDNDNEDKTVFDFEFIYKLYPRQIGKKKGIEYCKRKIKKQKDFDRLIQAVKNYTLEIQSGGIEEQFIKHFPTFMNCWEDYIVLRQPDTSINKPVKYKCNKCKDKGDYVIYSGNKMSCIPCECRKKNEIGNKEINKGLKNIGMFLNVDKNNQEKKKH